MSSELYKTEQALERRTRKERMIKERKKESDAAGLKKEERKET